MSSFSRAWQTGPGDGSGSDLAHAESIELSHRDRDTAASVANVAHEIRITTRPNHPGTDPVSQAIATAIADVLRGPGGIEERLHAIVGELNMSSERLRATANLYQCTDEQAAAGLKRAGQP